MSSPDKPVPSKLKNDAIVEALFEMRFSASTIPEIFYGRLADHTPWKGFEQRRLPAYEIPAPIRQADQNLRFQPVFELRDAGNRAVRIGDQVLSYHRLPPYVGWSKFAPELHEAIDGLFAAVHGLTVQRLGFRYINAIRPDLHGIASISALDLTIAVASEPISKNVNLNFTTFLTEDTQCTVRLATAEFVQGVLPPNTSVVVDVDVFTKESFKTTERAKVKQWIEFAHVKEKEHFFRLLTDETISALKES